MDFTIRQKKREADNKRKGKIISFIIHLLLLILIILPLIKYPVPAPGPEGVLVSFGQPEAGSPASLPASDESQVEEEPEPIPEPEPEPIPEPEPEPAIDPTPEPEPEAPAKQEVVEDVRSKERAIKKAQEEAERQKKEAEAEAERKRKQREAERIRQQEEAERRKQEEEAERKRLEAERKRAEQEKMLNKIQNAFNTGEGDGGENDKTGPEGNPDGEGDNALSGIVSGSGKVGGGLANRGGAGPKIQDSSQYEGVVIVKVCVNAKGQVVSAKYTAIGSTTSNATLIRLAEENARKWNFKSGSLDKQCGTITYDFKVK